MANPSLGYNVYRSNVACPTTGQPSGMAKVNTTVITTTTYTDSNLQPGSYCYAVTSTLNGVESADSNFAPAVIPPSAPTGLSVTAQ